MSYVTLPQFGGGGIEAYADFASLPSGVADGTVAITLDTLSLYAYDAGLSTWVSVGGTSNLTGLSGDVTATGPGVAVATIAAGAITNSMVSASAAIGLAKLAALAVSRAAQTDASGVLSTSAVTSTELGFVSGVTSAIQTQLNNKQATGNYITALTGNVVATGPGSVAATIQAGVVTNSMIATSAAIALSKLAALTASRAVVSSAGGVLTTATTTDTEIGYVSGVTSSIQTQLNGKQASGNYITALSGDVVATGPGSAAATIQANAVTTSKILDGAVTSAKIADGTIVDADINASAAIADTKLATISTAGKVSNSATTANASTSNDTIALRGGSGQLFAQFYVISAYAANNSFYAGDLAETSAVNVTNLQSCSATFVSDTMEFIVELASLGQLHCVCDVQRTGVSVISDRNNYFLATDSGTGFYIGKTSTSSRVLTFKNRLGSTTGVRIYAINSTLASITAWA